MGVERRKKENPYPTTRKFTITAFWTNLLKTLFLEVWFSLEKLGVSKPLLASPKHQQGYKKNPILIILFFVDQR